MEDYDWRTVMLDDGTGLVMDKETASTMETAIENGYRTLRFSSELGDMTLVLAHVILIAPSAPVRGETIRINSCTTMGRTKG